MVSKTSLTGYVLATAWIAILIGTTIPLIGTAPECSDKVWTFWDVLSGFVILTIPFIAGILAGTNSQKEPRK